jgi:hypothetical protein
MPSAPARLNAIKVSITQDSGSQRLAIAARSIEYSPETW